MDYTCEMDIAIIGLGGVSRAFLSLVEEKNDDISKTGLNLNIKYVLNSTGGIYNKNGIDLNDFNRFLKDTNHIKLSSYKRNYTQNANFDLILKNKDVDLVVELTQTNKVDGEPGLSHITRALENGISVVTANKGPIMLAYKELKSLANRNGLSLGIGCTTGGALPSINAGMIDMAGAHINKIEGILNGTSNYILKEIEEKGIAFSEALKMAQNMGIAEKDPSLDVNGWDTAIKLLILSNVLFDSDRRLDDISVQGITEITPEELIMARENNRKIRLVGKAIRKKDDVELSVELVSIDIDNPLYSADGKNKAVRYSSDTLGELTVIGGASGLVPAAASVLRDIIIINNGYKFN